MRIKNAGLKCAACGSLEMQDPKNRQNSPPWNRRTTLSGYIFATKAHIDNRKKIVNQQYTALILYRYNMMNFGALAAEICWRVWGTPGPAHFSVFRVLAELLHGTLVGVI